MSKKGCGDFGKETVGFSKNHRGTGRDQTEILGSRGIQERNYHASDDRASEKQQGLENG